MPNPRISVVCVTARPGGLDVLFTGLGQQTFTDFELILVDALYKRRTSLVESLAYDSRIQVRHIPPRQRILPYDAVPQARNAAIAKARGELILWLVDYTYLPEGSLEAHWRVWESSEKMLAAMGAHTYLEIPELAFELPSYSPRKKFPPGASGGATYGYDEEDSRQYVYEVLAGEYDKYMYSIFKVPLETPQQIDALPFDPLFARADPKLKFQPGTVLRGQFFHAKNESMPTAWARAINGFDEAYTSHIHDDTDFGNRVERIGEWRPRWAAMETRYAARIVNPRHVFPHLVVRDKFDTHKEKYYEVERNPDIVWAPNPYDIREMADMWWWY